MRSLPWFLLVAAASFFTLQFQSLPAADPIKIGGGPKDIVLAWDAARSDLPRTKEGPSLQVRGDGSLSVTDPHGAGQPIEAKLSADQLQDLLQFVVREQGIREIDSAKLEKEIRTARAKDGLPPEGSGVSRPGRWPLEASAAAPGTRRRSGRSNSWDERNIHTATPAMTAASKARSSTRCGRDPNAEVGSTDVMKAADRA